MSCHACLHDVILYCHLDPCDTDDHADKTWAVLEHAINEIHNQRASGLSFEELYR